MVAKILRTATEAAAVVFVIGFLLVHTVYCWSHYADGRK